MLPAVTRARRQRGMIVRHQKKQQSICKLPSWKYTQMKREDCSSWKTTIIPRSFLYARKFYRQYIHSTVQLYQNVSTQTPRGRTALKHKPRRSAPSAVRSCTGYGVLPSSHRYSPAPRAASHRRRDLRHQPSPVISICSSSTTSGADRG